MPDQHAEFAPSSLYRVIRCPASFQASKRVPRGKPSEYALKGSLLHDIVQKYCEDGDRKAFNQLEKEDQGYILDCVDHINTLRATMDEPVAESFESQVALDQWGIPEVWGTMDHALVNEDVFHFTDWKFGATPVYAHDNEQLMTYAAGMLGFPLADDANISIHIVQPQLSNVDTFEFNGAYLKEFIFNTLQMAIEEANSKHPSFVPGEKQCRFCPLGPTCPEKFKKTQLTAKEVFKKVRVLETITDDELGEFLVDVKELKKAIGIYEKYVLKRCLEGRKVSNWKVVSGRSNRKWKDEDMAAGFLENFNIEYMVTKIITPSKAEQLERTLKKDEFFKDLIDKPLGKPQLAPESDKRAPYIIDAFKDVPVGE